MERRTSAGFVSVGDAKKGTSAGFVSTGFDSTGLVSATFVSADAGDSAVDSLAATTAGALVVGAMVSPGNDAKNSASGFQSDFASSQARSFWLRLPSAILSRMTDSEKRPAYCPLR